MTGTGKIFAIVWVLNLISSPLQSHAQEYAVWKYSGQTLDFNLEPPLFSSDGVPSDYYNSSICNIKGKLRMFTSTDSTVHFLDINNSEVGQTGNPPRRKETYGRYNCGLIRLNDSLICYFYASGMRNLDINYLQDSVGLFMSKINTNGRSGFGEIAKGSEDIRVNSLPHGGLTFRLNADSSWWIISEYRDSLLAYKLLRNGSLLPPVVTPLHELEIPLDTLTFNPIITEMRFSHDGNVLVRGVYWDMPFSNRQRSSIFIYSFNETTGVFNNQKLIEEQNSNTGILFACSDIVFSPNDSLIYIVYSNHPTQKNVVQFKRFSPDISASGYCIHFSDFSDFGGVIRYAELGQNGKIYLSSDASDYSLIYRPNLEKAACVFLMNKMKISCNLGVSGNGCTLPNFPFSRYHGYKMNFDYRMNCDSTLQVLNLSDTINLTDFSWHLYGPNNFLDSIQETNPVFKLSVPGEYWLKFKGTTASGYQPWFSDSVQVEFLDVPKAQFTLANTEGCQFVSFSIKDGSTAQKIHPNKGQEWSWNFGDGKDTTINTGSSGDIQHIYTSTGNFIISLQYSNGYCTDTFTAISSVTIDDAPQPGITADNEKGCYPLISLFSDKYFDPIDSVVIEFGDGQRYVSLNHLNKHPHTYANPGIYRAVQYLYGSSGCVSQDSVEIVVLEGFTQNQIFELAYTTLQGKHIETKWLHIPVAKSYALDRHDEITNSWRRVYTGTDSVFIDKDIEPLLRYRYRVTAFDTCDQFVVSNEGSNIVLTGVNKDNVSSVLSWNQYSLWMDGLRDYTILKLDATSGFGVEIATSGSTTYEDLAFFNLGTDSVCYQVSATSNSDPDWVSNSNILCVRYSPVIWIPNSFTPNNDGLNEVFKPLMIGVRNEYYQLIIYDRWGAEIFLSTSKEEGWDGTFKSVPVPEGIYFYRISYSPVDINGNYTRMNAEGRIVIIR